MASCKDCLHVDVCEDITRHKLSPSRAKEILPFLREHGKTCEHFKDRSRFAELPAKSEGLVLSFPWKNVDREVIEMLWLTDFVRDHTDRGKAVRYDQKKENEE